MPPAVHPSTIPFSEREMVDGFTVFSVRFRCAVFFGERETFLGGAENDDAFFTIGFEVVARC